MGLVRYESGALGQFEVSWAFRGGMDLRDEVTGTEGTIWLNHWLRTGFEMFSSGHGTGYVAEKAEAGSGWLFPVGDESGSLGYTEMFADMLDSLEAGRAPAETFYDGYVVNAIMDAAYRAAASKRWRRWRSKSGAAASACLTSPPSATSTPSTRCSSRNDAGRNGQTAAAAQGERPGRRAPARVAETGGSVQSRERVRAALSHREPDRIPIDFGSTAVTGIHASVVAALRHHYGLEPRPVKVHEPYQMLGLVEDDLQQALGVDTDGVFARDTLFGFPNEGWRPWRAPWGQELLVSEHFRTTEEPSGDVVIHPQGDVAAEASGRMPASGYFFDAIVRQAPIDEDRLDPEDNMEEFQPIDEPSLAHLRREVSRVRASGRAVVATFGGTGFGDIALVPGLNLKQPRGIRDIAEWYISTAARKPYVHAVFERQCEVGLANLARIHAAVGDGVDAVFVCGTDFGTQNSPFCSVATCASCGCPTTAA